MQHSDDEDMTLAELGNEKQAEIDQSPRDAPASRVDQGPPTPSSINSGDYAMEEEMAEEVQAADDNERNGWRLTASPPGSAWETAIAQEQAQPPVDNPLTDEIDALQLDKLLAPSPRQAQV